MPTMIARTENPELPNGESDSGNERVSFTNIYVIACSKLTVISILFTRSPVLEYTY